MQDHQQKQTHQLTSAQIALMRSAVIAWDVSEYGAPVIGAWGNNTEDIYMDVAMHLGMDVKGGLSGEQESTIKHFLLEMEPAVQIAVIHGKLSPGVYRYKNVLPVAFNGMRLPASRYFMQQYPVSSAEFIDFAFTDQLRILIEAMNIYFLPYAGMIGVDSKHPYEGRLDYHKELAVKLGIPLASDGNLSAKNHNLIERLHQLGQPALQVFLQKMQLIPGTYVKTEKYGKWQAGES